MEKNTIPGWDTDYKPGISSRTGFHLGLVSEIPLRPNSQWFLSPGLLLQNKGNRYAQFFGEEIARQTDTLSHSADFYTNYIEFPLTLGRKFTLGGKTNFLLSAGPYLSFFYSGKNSSNTKLYYSDRFITSEEILEVGKDQHKIATIDAGLTVRGGFEFNRLLLTAFFSEGLTNFGGTRYAADRRHRVKGFSLGIWIGKPASQAPKDSDADGIPDTEDACPNEAGSAITGGCPDRDGDGIPDYQDECPETVGKKAYNGCPIPDRDGDGINDEEDKCPDIAGLEEYNGCPPTDTDGDGIPDVDDKCPEQSGQTKYGGCPPPDQDGDGIPDDEDKCPAKAGPRNNNGCPEIAAEIIEKVDFAASNILFPKGGIALAPSSTSGLDEVVKLLQADSALTLAIHGHTDNTGSPEVNKRISQQRAAKVKEYLVSRGIPSERLIAEGFGQERPIAENNSEAGRAKNRRVELRLFERDN